MADTNNITTSELTRTMEHSNGFKLSIVQYPEEGRALPQTKSTKGHRWPLDPPPVLELESPDSNSQNWLHIHNPNWFCTAELVTIQTKKNPQAAKDPRLTGLLVSSLHKVKINNEEHGYFVFGDLNVDLPGIYRLRFTLFEIRRDGQAAIDKQTLTNPYAAKVHTTEGKPFEVYGPKGSGKSAKDSTKLSRDLAENGIKLRLRKEATKRKRVPFEWSATPQTALARPSSHFPPLAANHMEQSQSLTHRNMGEDVSRRVSIHQQSLLQQPVVNPQRSLPNVNHGAMVYQPPTQDFTQHQYPLPMYPAQPGGRSSYPSQSFSSSMSPYTTPVPATTSIDNRLGYADQYGSQNIGQGPNYVMDGGPAQLSQSIGDPDNQSSQLMAHRNPVSADQGYSSWQPLSGNFPNMGGWPQ